MNRNVDELVPAPLRALRDLFVRDGFDLRLVGGCVRDFIKGEHPHDVDLCTDAFPDEQLALYQKHGLKYIETGLQHGTLTVVLDGESYEITSLRTEDEHDGRYAKMTYTRDWVEDLSRRDLTINAMSLDFDGNILDPFGGQADLEAHVVRFVGDAEGRMTEDYLRILRYFRFLGRMHPTAPSSEVLNAMLPRQEIMNCVHGLRGISAERIWTETSKILTHFSGYWVYPLMMELGVGDYTALPTGDDHAFRWFHVLKTKDLHHVNAQAALLLTPFMKDEQQVDQVAKDLKWRSAERDVVKHVISYDGVVTSTELMYQLLVMGKKPEHVYAAALFYDAPSIVLNKLQGFISGKAMPAFPVTGDDLKTSGVKPGPLMGQMMKKLREYWFYSDCSTTKQQLLDHLSTHQQ